MLDPVIVLLNTTSSGITLIDVSNAVVPAGVPYSITDTYPISVIADSLYLHEQVSANKILISNGAKYMYGAEAVAYLDRFKSTIKKDLSGKLRVQETCRAVGTTTVWTGVGDDASDVTDVGGGQEFNYSHVISGSLDESIYLDFNCIENETWLHEGYIVWKDCALDKVSLSLVPDVVSGTVSSGTYYNLYGGYLVVPAAADGMFNLTSDLTQPHGGLVYMPDTDLGEPPIAYWNAEWNSTTKKFENISAAPLGNGRYNIFAAEVPLAKFVHRLSLLASGFERLQSADAHMMGHGMKLKMECETNTSIAGDHAWQIACILTMHRAKTA